MKKTRFKIGKMDCPSEEQMIRMKLEGLTEIESLEFDIPGRRLTIYHNGGYDLISERLEELDLGASFLDSSDSGSPLYTENPDHQRRLLWQVLAINLFFFILELGTGFIARSMGLLADSLDMLADSFVYGLALMAVGGTVIYKRKIARASGIFQMILVVAGLAEVLRRFITEATLPAPGLMIVISALALGGNTACLYLLQRSRSREAHMQASMIFTSNDIIANAGVLLAGGLVLMTGSRFPDLIIGGLVFILVLKGAFKILRL